MKGFKTIGLTSDETNKLFPGDDKPIKTTVSRTYTMNFSSVSVRNETLWLQAFYGMQGALFIQMQKINPHWYLDGEA